MALKKTDSLPRLFLIRHSDTDWTDSHRHTGRTDLLLNVKGEERARDLGVRLKGKHFARVFVSPLLRVRHTCDLAGFSPDAIVNPDLVEWDYGALDYGDGHVYLGSMQAAGRFGNQFG